MNRAKANTISELEKRMLRKHVESDVSKEMLNQRVFTVVVSIYVSQVPSRNSWPLPSRTSCASDGAVKHSQREREQDEKIIGMHLRVKRILLAKSPTLIFRNNCKRLKRLG